MNDGRKGCGMRLMKQVVRKSSDVLLVAGCSACFGLAGCVELPDEQAHDADGPQSPDRAHDEEHVELAEDMGRMQYYTQKLGYSILAQNGPLAEFYHHELEELSESVIRDIPVYEGLPIGPLTEQLLLPILDEQHDSLESRDWETAWSQYDRLILTCNACHQKTGYGFIVMTPAKGDSPFNQQFEQLSP